MDTIADMLTRISNAEMARHEKVDIPKSKVKLAITKILKEEGYIKTFKEIKDNKQNILRLILKYDDNGEPVIKELKKISKCSLRKYVGCRDIPRVRKGMGVAILSTSQGVLTDKAARQKKCGGELLCYVW